MIDSTTNRPLHVSSGGNAGPYIMVPFTQLERVKTALDTNSLSYWVDEEVISLNGEPEVAVINLGRGIDAAAVQQHLDSIP